MSHWGGRGGTPKVNSLVTGCSCAKIPLFRKRIRTTLSYFLIITYKTQLKLKKKNQKRKHPLKNHKIHTSLCFIQRRRFSSGISVLSSCLATQPALMQLWWFEGYAQRLIWRSRPSAATTVVSVGQKQTATDVPCKPAVRIQGTPLLPCTKKTEHNMDQNSSSNISAVFVTNFPFV